MAKIPVTLLPTDETKTERDVQRIELPGGAWLEHERGYLTAGAADELFAALLDSVSWEQRTIRIFGRAIVQPRLIGWGGDVSYRYSGQTLEPRPIPTAVVPLFERIAHEVREPFNHVLFNRYRDGQDAMGMHSDDEPELGENPVLASLSLGVTRRFVVVPRKKSARKARRLELELTHGSLLTMGGTLQHLYRHGVPRQLAVRGARINLTFRHLFSEPAS